MLLRFLAHRIILSVFTDDEFANFEDSEKKARPPIDIWLLQRMISEENKTPQSQTDGKRL